MHTYDEWAEREDAVFVVGPARSGTSVMFRTLYEAPGFWPLKDRSETYAFDPGLLKRRPLPASTIRYLGKRHDSFIAAADTSNHSPRALVRLYFYEASQRYGSGRLVEKTPRHVYQIPAIMEAFPRAHVVFMSRNVRDIVISHRVRYERDRARGVAESQIEYLRAPIEELLERFHHVDTAISLALNSWSERILCVSYDRMIESPAAQLQTVGEHLSMPTKDIEVMIQRAMAERASAADKTHSPISDAALGRTARHVDVLTPAEESAIAAVSFIHL